jgi:hypothetical protein
MNEYVYGFTVLVLLGLNIYQFIHWTKEFQKVLDKSMCKDFTEYVQSENLKLATANHPGGKSKEDLVREEEEERAYLSEVNRMVGL